MDELHNPFFPYADWRVSLLGEGRPWVHKVYEVNLVASGITTIIYGGILFHLLRVKKGKVFQFEGGVFRPHPLPGYVACAFVFMIGRTLFCAMMISGVLGYGHVRNEGYIMEAFHEWPWGFGYSSCVLYLIGL
ncbi:uncharacterized protein EV422DRAFT_236931 [Fimicolochytrium jonesii]|uniref:uncharacterized protein n=1 Tax=Fimicolochytrium jonesii TaxID=1396493 RepID=UPI0022FE5A7E|nr:uncharacterized protein EV422DRAFT_236931 [Fimicolochytrium jonesii]KAI8824890.1 hypothetical protein EV422DRAFT_236931 [Fimicolochytrium jonesii]